MILGHSSSTLDLLTGIGRHLRPLRLIQLAGVLGVMLASGLAELVSLGTVLPFLGVLSSPEQLWQQPLVQWLVPRAGYTHPQQLILPATVAFALAAVVAASIRIFNLRLNCRLVAAIGSDLSSAVYRRTLYQSYEKHLLINSSKLIASISSHITVTVQALNASLQGLSGLSVVAGLLVAMSFIDWLVALSAAALFGIAYSLVVVRSRYQLRNNSALFAEASYLRLKYLQEGLGAIREVVLRSNQDRYYQNY